MRDIVGHIQGDSFSPQQLAAVVRLHREHVGHGFMSSLGEPFLRVLYEHIAASQHCGVFVAYPGPESDAPLGYICGTSDTSALYRQFIRHRWRRALRTLVPRLLSPTRLLGAVETLRYPRGGADLPRAEIINFVVVPAARGQGVAPALFRRLMGWFQDQGCVEVKIVTGEQQVRAHGLYEKVGAKLHSRMSVHRGSLSRVYVYPVADRSSPAV